MVIEDLVNSKIRAKILRLFLYDPDRRYYLREMERRLELSLSPLRRQLLKLRQLGILIVEEEANLKYYKLNKNFEGIDQLQRLVVSREETKLESSTVKDETFKEEFQLKEVKGEVVKKEFKYAVAVLTVVAVCIFAGTIFMVYINTRSMKEAVTVISEKLEQRAPVAKPQALAVQGLASDNRAMPDEMASKKWKVIPGNIPVFSEIESKGEGKSREL